MVTEYLVYFNFGKARSRTNDARPLVFVNLIIADVDATVVHYNAVLVVEDVIVFDPAVASFDAEYAFRP